MVNSGLPSTNYHTNMSERANYGPVTDHGLTLLVPRSLLYGYGVMS